MARYVEKGIIDLSLTGADWVKAGSDVRVVVSLVYAKQQLTEFGECWPFLKIRRYARFRPAKGKRLRPSW